MHRVVRRGGKSVRRVYKAGDQSAYFSSRPTDIGLKTPAIHQRVHPDAKAALLELSGLSQKEAWNDFFQATVAVFHDRFDGDFKANKITKDTHIILVASLYCEDAPFHGRFVKIITQMFSDLMHDDIWFVPGVISEHYEKNKLFFESNREMFPEETVWPDKKRVILQ